jgi:HEAT repeat protein
LLKELATAKDAKWKIGLVNSLGQRKAESAVPAITKALSDTDPKIADSAATALLNIANEASIKALTDALERPAGTLYMKAAQALIDVAQGKAANKDYAGAVKIYESLYDRTAKITPSPAAIRAAALNGMIMYNSNKASGEIENAMKGKDSKIRSIAVQAARNATTIAPTQTLAQMLSRLEPSTQVQVLSLIGDRADPSLVKYAKEALSSQDESVRLAAIGALSKTGDSDSAKTLMDIAVKPEQAASSAAFAGLVNMAGTSVDELIKSQAAKGELNARIIAINLMGSRRITGASKILLGYAADKDPKIRAASFDALNKVVNASDAAALAKLLVTTKDNQARQSCLTALRTALAKADDKDAAARIVIEQTKTADSDAQYMLISSLNSLGGAEALKAVVEATKSRDAKMADAAIRTLSGWPDYAAAQELVSIAAKPQTSLTGYVLALGGAVRLIQTSTAAALDDRTKLCLAAYDCARRDDERKLVISAMGALPTTQMVDKLLAIVKNDNLKAEAGMAAIQLAGNMFAADRQAAQDLARKIRDMNISNQVNSSADNIISGRGMRGMRSMMGGRRGQ